MPLKFYLDTHIAKVVVVQLRNRGIDAVRCEEVGMAAAKDFEHLEYATQEGRVMVTQDDDFARFHAQWLQEAKSHGGIMILPKELKAQAQISYAVRELLAYYEIVDTGGGTIKDDIAGQLIFL